MQFQNLRQMLRLFRRQKLYTVVNVCGLTIGMACAILVMLWVQDELSYDQFHVNVDRLYRVIRTDEQESSSVVSTPLAPAAQAQIPDVELATRYRPIGKQLLGYQENSFSHWQAVTVDRSFFQMFFYKVVNGDPASTFKGTDSIVLTASSADALFGGDDALGKTVLFANEFEFTVCGVLEDRISNTSLEFDFLIPFESIPRIWGMDPETWLDDWHDHSQRTFVLLSRGSDPTEAVAKIDALVKSNHSDDDSRYVLESLLDLRLRSTGNDIPMITLIWVFASVAALILLIACLNFINLTTARASVRAREVGVRKAIGASRSTLIFQFFTESLFLTLIAAFVAIVLASHALPIVNNLAHKSLHISYNSNPALWIYISGIAFLTAILSGIYPSWYLSHYQTVTVLKPSSYLGVSRGLTLRRLIIGSQVALTVLMLVSAVVVLQQVDFINRQELGYRKDNILYINSTSDLLIKLYGAREELDSNPDIVAYTITNTLPGWVESGWSGFRWETDYSDEEMEFQIVMANTSYQDVFGLEMVEGRFFSKDAENDGQAFIINESAAKAMGFIDQSAVGTTLECAQYWERTGEIIGVVKDYHSSTLHDPIEPLIIFASFYVNDTFCIRVQAGALNEGIDFLESFWKKHAPEYTFDYRFFDEVLAENYQSEQNMATILTWGSGLAIFISLIGLAGLISFLADQKTKEIGIRKVLGASRMQIISLFTREYILLITIATVIVSPIGWILLQNWLSYYVYHVQLHWWVFPLAGLFTLTLSLLFSGGIALKRASILPATILRDE
jgi:putative ABC transport system permease protein